MTELAIYDANLLIGWVERGRDYRNSYEFRLLEEGRFRLVMTAAWQDDVAGGFKAAKNRQPHKFEKVSHVAFNSMIQSLIVKFDAPTRPFERRIPENRISFAVPEDSRDNHLAVAAIASQAKYLVTYDHHVLALRFNPEFLRLANRTFIVRPEELREILAKSTLVEQMERYGELSVNYLRARERGITVETVNGTLHLTKPYELLGHSVNELEKTIHSTWGTNPKAELVIEHKRRRSGGDGNEGGSTPGSSGGSVPPSSSPPPTASASPALSSRFGSPALPYVIEASPLPQDKEGDGTTYTVEASMLSIQKVSAVHEGYYVTSTTEEYYLAESPASFWLGRGAESLGLKGTVVADDFHRLFRGVGPDGTKLTQNAGSDKHTPGWDLTFSMPKSAGVIWAVADPELKAKLEAAHLSAVKAGIRYLEQEAAISRTQKSGSGREHVGLVVAGFHHSTSRLEDPQPHTHCLVINAGMRDDGRFGSLYSPHLYKHKMAAGAVYQATLSAELGQIGFRTEAVRSKSDVPLGYFEVIGVPRYVQDHFSKRSQAIRQELESMGHSSAAAAEIAALSTRDRKNSPALQGDLLERWKSEAAERGWTTESARELMQKPMRIDSVPIVDQAMREAKEKLTSSVSTFTERELYRETLIRTLGQGVHPDLVQAAVKDALHHSSDFLAVGRHKNEYHFTTKEIWRQEERLLDTARQLADRTTPSLDPRNIERAMTQPRLAGDGKTKFELSREQKEAVDYLTKEGGSVRVLSGYAGTGKTAVLGAVRELYEKEGFIVYGMSVAGIAARGLEQGSGIKSDTIAMRMMDLERTWVNTWKHHGRQIIREALGLPTYQLDSKLKIDKNTVLVVDEAGMLGSKDLAKLTKAVLDGGGRLILVGDHRQIPPIEAGGGFRAIAERHKMYELTDVIRQRSDVDRQFGKRLADGQARDAFRKKLERKELTIAPTWGEAKRTAVTEWSKYGIDKPQDNILIALKKDDVRDLNRLAQNERKIAGQLGTHHVHVGELIIHVNDRVMFRQKSRSLNFENGEFGTVTAIHGNKLEIKVDKRSDPVVVSLDKYDKLTLGYAITAHKAQGATFENAHVLAGGWGTSREMGYVMGTRAKGTTHFYTDRFEAGDPLTKRQGIQPSGADSRLVKQMTQSAEKRLAHDLRERSNRVPPPPPPPPPLTPTFRVSRTI